MSEHEIAIRLLYARANDMCLSIDAQIESMQGIKQSFEKYRAELGKILEGLKEK